MLKPISENLGFQSAIFESDFSEHFQSKILCKPIFLSEHLGLQLSKWIENMKI